MSLKSEKKRKRKRLASIETIMRDQNITHVYIKKGGWYYREKSSGYTEKKYMPGFIQNRK